VDAAVLRVSSGALRAPRGGDFGGHRPPLQFSLRISATGFGRIGRSLVAQKQDDTEVVPPKLMTLGCQLSDT